MMQLKNRRVYFTNYHHAWTPSASPRYNTNQPSQGSRLIKMGFGERSEDIWLPLRPMIFMQWDFCPKLAGISTVCQFCLCPCHSFCGISLLLLPYFQKPYSSFRTTQFTWSFSKQSRPQTSSPAILPITQHAPAILNIWWILDYRFFATWGTLARLFPIHGDLVPQFFAWQIPTSPLSPHLNGITSEAIHDHPLQSSSHQHTLLTALTAH